MTRFISLMVTLMKAHQHINY